MAPTRRLVVLGGSGASTPELADALAAWPGSPDRRPPLELILAGRSRDKLALVARAFRARLGSGGPPVTVREATDLAAAVDGADVILNQVRVGGLAARAFDESFPRAFGIPGEETMGPGGFANAVRTLPALRRTWAVVAERAPDTLVVNLTNPAGIVVQAAIREFGVRAVAVCDSPVVLADAVSARLGRPAADVRCRYVGMNHLGWWVAERPATLDLVADLATGLSADEVRTIGALPAPYGRYYHVPGRLLAAQGSGPTRAEALLRLERGLLAAYRKGGPDAPRRGAAWYPKAVVPFLDAWWNGSEVPVLLGVPNAGRVSGPGDEAIVEHAVAVPAPGRLEPIAPPALPALPAGLLAAHAAYEALTVDALLAGGDRRSLTRALAANPLVGDLDRAAALVDEILAASRAT